MEMLHKSRYSFFFMILLILQNHGSYADCQKQEKCDEESGLISFGLKTAGVATVVIVGAPFALGAAGFTAAGVAAGSLAASVQSAVFGGAITGMTGALFSGLQSIGAAGLGLAGKTLLVTTSGVGVKTYEYVKESSKEKQRC